MMHPDIADALIAQSIAQNTDDEITVGCLPVNMLPAVPSGTHTCSGCGRLIWVSMRILAVLPDHAKTLCIDCIAGNLSRLN